jgi:hypothetical protein
MNRYVLSMLGVAFWGGFVARGQVDPCSSVAPAAAFVSPYDVTRLHLACLNTSTEEIFSYPTWKVFGSEGDLLAEESLTYFGLVDTTWHVLNVLNPLDFNTGSLEVTLELTWSSLTGAQTCEFAYVMEPWVPSPNPDAECMLVQVHTWGTLAAATGFHFSLFNVNEGQEVASFDVVANDAGFWPYDDVAEACLDWDQCYTLSWEPLGEPQSTAPVYVEISPGEWGNSAWFDFTTVEIWPLEAGSVYLDAYELDCDTTAVDAVQREPSPALRWTAANPARTSSAVPQGWRGAEVWSVDGRALGAVNLQGGWPAGTQGWVILKKRVGERSAVARVWVGEF